MAKDWCRHPRNLSHVPEAGPADAQLYSIPTLMTYGSILGSLM